MPVRGVVRHNVDDHLQADRVQRVGHLVEIGERAEPRVDVAVVVHVVSAVSKGGRTQLVIRGSTAPPRR